MACVWYATSLHSCLFFFFSSRRRHTRCSRDWSSDVCSSDLRTWRRGSGRYGRWCSRGSVDRRRRRTRGPAGKGQRDNVIGAKGLNFAVHFKTKNVLRATEILSLHNSAALELQSVGGGQTHKKQPHDDGSEKTLQVTHTSLSHPDSLKAGGLRVLPGGVAYPPNSTALDVGRARNGCVNWEIEPGGTEGKSVFEAPRCRGILMSTPLRK